MDYDGFMWPYVSPTKQWYQELDNVSTVIISFKYDGYNLFSIL